MTFLEKIKNILGMASIESSLPAQGEYTEPLEVVSKHPAMEGSPKSIKKGLPPAAELRTDLNRFIIEKLRPYQNESTGSLSGLRLLLVCEDSEQQELYRVALWDKQPERFREDLNRYLTDNYIVLPPNWQFEYAFFEGMLPDCTFRQGSFGLVILDRKAVAGPVLTATVHIIDGQTEQNAYSLNPAQKISFCIGRGHMVQSPSGRSRINDIAFLDDDNPDFDAQLGAPNEAVSRNHATIKYNPERRQFYLKVDQGGLPSNGNKTKILRADDSVERADVSGIDYLLKHEDQIELGGVARLLFLLD